MQVFVTLGWLFGVALAVAVGIPALVGIGAPLAGILGSLAGTILAPIAALLTALAGLFAPLAGLIAGILGGLSFIVAVLVVLAAITVAYLVFYLAAYALATVSIGPLLPALTATPAPLFPAAAPFNVPPPATAPVFIPPTFGESFARGMMAGFNAAINFLLLTILGALTSPFWAVLVASFAFVVISLVAIIPVARNRVFQGFLGWTSWLLPMSYIASFVGLILFLFNLIASLATASPTYRVNLDFTTGVVESADGFIATLTAFTGGFSLGTFTFLTNSGSPPGSFAVPSVNSHETGHSLSTAAFGGVILWINAVDQNVAPFSRQNLAYTELIAEGHSTRMAAPSGLPPVVDFVLRVWV